MKKKILVIAAHPDDEVLGCGGALSKFSKLGYEVNVAFFSDGVSSRDLKLGKKKKEILQRKKSSYRAAKILGINKIEFFDLPDNQFDTIPLLKIVKLVESLIKKYSPSTIFTHYDNDLNIDHRMISRAVVTTTRPYPGSCVKRLLFFEIPSSTEWNFSSSLKSFSPNYFINIDNELRIKLKAIKCYPQELRKWPHPRSLEGINNLAKTRGATCGFKSAESFILVREIFS
jgi:LmbE family N-acetylglucosaminyl deacetylase|tara:strand:+ start:971 stop:1657 length:687 start_codon:yes stop_codon:yes gene_type:complete